MKNFLQNAAKKAILCLFLTASLLLCACTFVIPLPTAEPTTTTTPSADDYALMLQQRAASETDNPDCHSVADWLVYWGAVLDDAKLRFVESVASMYSVFEIGAPLTVAQTSVALYCEFCLDYAPLSDTRVQTDLWLYCYVASIGDPYANYYSQEDMLILKEEESGQYAGIGVSVTENADPAGILVMEVFKNTPAEAAGILIGDVIVAIDGASVTSTGYEEAASAMKGAVGTSVDITVNRGGEIITFTIVRALIDTPVIEYKMIEQGDTQIGYIHISTFSSGLAAQKFREAVDALVDAGADALLFDVRHNTGGYVYQVLEMLDYLLVDGKPLMHARYYDESVETTLGEDGHFVDLPMGVLCSDFSASASEIFISTLKDYGAVGDCEFFSVGITSLGKGCMQGPLEFTDGTTLYVTFGYFDPPYSASYDGIGITPDYVVELAPEYQYVNISSIPEGFDTQLAKALEILAGE